MLQEDIKIDPRTLKELEFALPPKDCSRPCQEAIASILYNTAMRFRRMSYSRMARSYLQYILLYYGGTRHARIAKLHLLQWDTQQESQKRLQQGKPLQDDGIDRRGRIEFIVLTSLYGIYFGSTMPFAFINNPGGGWVGLSLLGFTTAAVLSSILGTMNSEMTPGQASSASVGMLWGLLTGGMLFAGLSTSSISASDGLKLLFIGPLVGYAAGVIIPRFTRPTAGQIALGSSAGIWLAGYSAMIWGAIVSTGGLGTISPWSVVIPVLASAYGGLIGGVLLHGKLDWSRSRTLLINLGGVLGTVLASGVFSLASIGGSFNTPVFLITMLLSSLAGKIITFFLTGKMPAESEEEGKPRKTASLGALANYQDGQWSIGTPIPIVTNDPTAPGANRIEIHIPILRGQW